MYPSSTNNFTEMAENSSADVDTSTLETCQKFDLIVNTGIIGVLCILGFIGNTVSIVVLRKDTNNRVAVFLLQVGQTLRAQLDIIQDFIN